MNILKYKGFHAIVEFDAEDEILVGHIAGINDVVGFHAETSAGIRDVFHEAVEDYVATCARVGKVPEKAYSGQMMLRVEPEVHAMAALAAQLDGKSLNQWAQDVMRTAAAGPKARVAA